jgi:hypothetical protein
MSKHTPTPWTVHEGLQIVRGSSAVATTQVNYQTRYRLEDAAFIVLAVNAHEKLLAAVKMVFEAADEASSQELGQNIDWDMLRDAYNIGLKGEA